jgi:hypothetical protein
MSDPNTYTFRPLDDAPAEPSMVLADASPEFWGGDDPSLALPGRHPVPVSPAVKAYVIAEKAAAFSMSEPVSARLREFLPALRNAAAPHRAVLTEIATDLAAMKAAPDITTGEAAGFQGLAKGRTHQTRTALKTAIATTAKEYAAWIATEEAGALADLDALPSRTPSPTDIEWAGGLMQSLMLMPPDTAAPIARRFLVTEPIAVAGQPVVRKVALRRAAALLPVVLGMAQSNVNGFGKSAAIAALLREADVVQRDRDFYHAHRRLDLARRASWRLATVARTFAEHDGDPDAPGAAWLRSPLMKDLDRAAA